MMKKKIVLLPLVLLIVLLAVGTAAAQTPVSAAVEVPAGTYTVGDPVELTLSITHPEGYQVITPELPETWGSLRVAGQSPAVTVNNGDGSATTTIQIDTRLFAPGEYSTPPLTVSVTDGTGQLNEVTAAPVPITITSVLVEGDTALRDIKPQAELPFTNLAPWIAGGLLVGAAAVIFILWWRRRQARLALALIDNRLPHEIALDTLQEIEQLGLPEQNRFKEHYTLVSNTVRLYIERVYAVPMLERTTGEIQAALKETNLSLATTRQLVHFLEESDLVKFSKFKPNEATAYELITQARTLVKETKPIVISKEDVDGDQTKSKPPTGHTFSANGQMLKSEVSA